MVNKFLVEMAPMKNNMDETRIPESYIVTAAFEEMFIMNPADKLIIPKRNVAALKKSIVAQIDDILQEKVLNSPLKDRGVRLMESVDGSMSVYIGFDRYIDIDSIPDEDVIAIIRASVKEWEQRQ